MNIKNIKHNSTYLKATPNSINFEKTLAKSLKNRASSLAYRTTHFLNSGSLNRAISLGSIIRVLSADSYCKGPVHGFPS